MTVRDKPHGPSFLQQRGHIDRLDSVSIRVIKKNQKGKNLNVENTNIELMDPTDSPATPRIAKIIAKIVKLHVCCSLSLVIIYKK